MPDQTETKPSPETEAPQQLELETEQAKDTAELFAKASEHLEEGPEEPKPKPPATPEEELEIVEGEKKPPEAETAPETEPEPEPEPKPEPKKSKRELFKEKAEADKVNRDKETRLKEREAKLETQLNELNAMKRQLDEDPIAYLEKKNPKLYEEWTERNLGGGAKESAEMAAVKAELKELKETLTSKQEETVNQVQQAQYAQYMNEAKTHLSKEEYKDAQEDAEIWEHFTGQPVDVDRAVANVYAEYKTQYNKELTPADCCEIINEDAQAHLERIGSFIEFVATKKPELFKQSKTIAELFGQTPAKETLKTVAPPQTSGKTLTNEQETQSVPAGEIDPSKYNSKQEYLDAVAKSTLEYQE